MTGYKWLAGMTLGLGLLDLAAVNMWIWPRANAHAGAVQNPPPMATAKTVEAPAAPRAENPALPTPARARNAPEKAAEGRQEWKQRREAPMDPKGRARIAQRSGSGSERTPEGSRTRSTTILFATGSAALSPQAREALDGVADQIDTVEPAKVTIAGHADPRGTTTTNARLGERRAHAVAAYLLARGAGDTQLEVVSYGEKRPVAGGESSRARRLSRRVEISFRKEGT